MVITKRAGNDVTYTVHIGGPTGGRPLLLLHGFTGSGAAWGPFGERLGGAGYRTLAPDLPGHGQTQPLSLNDYTINAVADALVGVMRGFDVAPPVDVYGYSMGGRTALAFAARHPGWVGRLWLESATAGIADDAERAQRRAADARLADWIEAHGIAAFVDRWEQHPIFASQQALPAEIRARQRAQRLTNSPTGLARSLRSMGTGSMPPLWDRLGDITAPLTVIAGALDAKYVAIGRALAAALPRAQLHVVPDVGHNVHLEAPSKCSELLQDGGRQAADNAA